MVDVFKKGEMELPALNDVWYSEVIDNWMCYLYNLMDPVKVCVMVEYGPNERDGEEREKF